MSQFNAVKIVNLLYVIGIVSIALYSNVVQASQGSSLQDKLIVVISILFIAFPNIISINALSEKLKLAKTTVVLNAMCILIFLASLLVYEQESLAIYWGATVISISSINILVLVLALVRRRGLSSISDGVVHS